MTQSTDSDPDAQLLGSIAKIRNFFEAVLYEDHLEDWTLARDLGRLLIRIEPDKIMGHALLARACRHLGDSESAVTALRQCRRMIDDKEAPSDKELFSKLLADEHRFLPEAFNSGPE